MDMVFLKSKPSPMSQKCASMMMAFVWVSLSGNAAFAHPQDQAETTKADTQKAGPVKQNDVPENDINQPNEPERELTASELNARQRIKQTVTVRRSLNGKIIEEKTVDIPDNITLPSHATEAGTSISQIVRQQVDREVLTRREALTEANLDFTLADVNTDKTITDLEFSNLWEVRQIDENYRSILTDENGEPYSEEAYRLRVIPAMTEKFRLMSGIQSTLTRKEYIAEVLRDFDSMDANGDYILRDLELLNFRRVSVGMDAE